MEYQYEQSHIKGNDRYTLQIGWEIRDAQLNNTKIEVRAFKNKNEAIKASAEIIDTEKGLVLRIKANDHQADFHLDTIGPAADESTILKEALRAVDKAMETIDATSWCAIKAGLGAFISQAIQCARETRAEKDRKERFKQLGRCLRRNTANICAIAAGKFAACMLRQFLPAM